MKKFISDGTWFKKGTEAELICQMGDDFGLFKGIREEHEDEEICGFDEFEISEE